MVLYSMWFSTIPTQGHFGVGSLSKIGRLIF